MTTIVGKNSPPAGDPPAIALWNPKYPHNVGCAIRAASCFGFNQVWFSGNRVSLTPDKKYRLPREERMRGYKDVNLYQYDNFFDQFPKLPIVAIELKDNSENLLTFEHPDKALYVFGPEDGSLNGVALRHCHRFITIPTKHCTNLSAAVYIVMYDRMMKRYLNGQDELKPINEYLTEGRGIDEKEIVF